MRVLVTGSLGTLGAPLVAELRARGHDVWGCDRRHSGDDMFIRADVAEYRQLSRAFSEAEPDCVYHLAAEFGRHNGEDFYEDLWRTGTIGTRNVLELCKGFGARLAFASSSEIYGEVEADWLREDLDRAAVLQQPNEYALSKWTNERQVVNFQRRYGLTAVRLRFFNAYGPGEEYTPYRSVVAQFCHNALAGEPLKVFEGYHRTFMYIDDFTPTLANVCEAELKHGVYNIGGEDYRPVGELAGLILGLTLPGDAITPEHVEFIPEDLHNVRNKRPDISRAREELDHNPTILLEEGVPKTLAWMRQKDRHKEGVT